MRPLLVSLALLLLALCRSSSAGFYDDFQFPDEEKRLMVYNAELMDLMVAAESVLSGTPIEQLEKVANAVGPDAKKALTNGVLCALDPIRGLTPEGVKEKLYGRESTTPDETALASKYLGITCPSDVNTITDEIAKCFCKDKYVLVYCAGLKYKTEKLKDAAQPTKCLKEAQSEIYSSYSKALYLDALAMFVPGSRYNFLKNFYKSDASVFSDIMIGLWWFCDFYDKSNIDDELKPLVDKLKAMYLLSFAYYTVEDAFEKEIMTEVSREEGCKTDLEFKESFIGKCLCAFDKGGYLYCALKNTAEISIKSGFMNCTGSHDESKIPTSLPRMLPKKITTTTSTSTPAPTTTVVSKEDEADSNKEKTGAANGFSLLVAPAAAAAAMLLRH